MLPLPDSSRSRPARPLPLLSTPPSKTSPWAGLAPAATWERPSRGLGSGFRSWETEGASSFFFHPSDFS